MINLLKHQDAIEYAVLADLMRYASNRQLLAAGLDSAQADSIERALRAGAANEAKIDALVKALTKARARIHYLGAAASDSRHFVANERDFLPEIDAALAVSSNDSNRGDAQS